MGDLIKFEVGKIFPGPVPAEKGAQMELRHDTLTVVIQMPGLSKDQLKAFHKGFKQYSYLESDTPVPIALWIFDVPDPYGLFEANFNARHKRKWVDSYLDVSDDGVINNVIHFFLLDGQILEAMELVELDPVAVELFHGTIRKQLDLDYNRSDFDRCLAGLHNYDVYDLFSMGKVFKHRVRSGSLIKSLLCFRQQL
jgi:hypothetical protein